MSSLVLFILPAKLSIHSALYKL